MSKPTTQSKYEGRLEKIIEMKKSFRQKMRDLPFHKKIELLVEMQKAYGNMPGIKRKVYIWDIS
ncbi:MAG TPA: hypothetical protein VLB01_08150 [Thermodesulfobacteriota bacterium]|nr:hypothetical protein [Thermodesulfobacteriota bacterium]